MRKRTTQNKKNSGASDRQNAMSWQYLMLIFICGCVLAAGFFFAAHQHFLSMDYGYQNSKLRKQVEDLETEKRRLLLAREVAQSPFEIKRAVRNASSRLDAPTLVAASVVDKAKGTALGPAAATAKADERPRVVKTSITVPTVETRSAPAAKSQTITRERILASDNGPVAKLR